MSTSGDTFEQIQQLARERFNLYRLSGKQTLTPEQQTKLNTLTNQLFILWDTHRRELASHQRMKPGSSF